MSEQLIEKLQSFDQNRTPLFEKMVKKMFFDGTVSHDLDTYICNENITDYDIICLRCNYSEDHPIWKHLLIYSISLKLEPLNIVNIYNIDAVILFTHDEGDGNKKKYCALIKLHPGINEMYIEPLEKLDDLLVHYGDDDFSSLVGEK